MMVAKIEFLVHYNTAVTYSVPQMYSGITKQKISNDRMPDKARTN